LHYEILPKYTQSNLSDVYFNGYCYSFSSIQFGAEKDEKQYFFKRYNSSNRACPHGHELVVDLFRNHADV
jgi:hypothetical protein